MKPKVTLAKIREKVLMTSATIILTENLPIREVLVQFNSFIYTIKSIYIHFIWVVKLGKLRRIKPLACKRRRIYGCHLSPAETGDKRKNIG